MDGAAFAHTMFGVDTAPLVPMEKPLVSPFAVSERTVLVLPVDQRGSAPKNRSTFDVCHPPADFQNSVGGARHSQLLYHQLSMIENS